MAARTRVTNRSRSGAAASRSAVGDIHPSGTVATAGFRIQHRTFFGAPPRDRADARSDVVFLGAPFDLGTSLRPGTRFGPDAIRAASGWWQYARDEGDAAVPNAGPPTAEGWYDLDLGRWILRGVSMADWGDVRITPTSLTANLDRITAGVQAVLHAGSFPVLIGGDHSVTFPAIRAFAGQGPLHLVQFDSHQDFTDERHGVRYGHGNPIRRASELPFVTGISQIGLRALTKYTEPLDAARRYGVRTVSASELRRRGPRAAAACVPPRGACYLTLDIDALDIAVAPGTGTPEPGGLTLAEMREAVRAIARRSRIVGLDLVEVAPPYDWAEVTARAGARLLLDALSAIFDRPDGLRTPKRLSRPRRRPPSTKTRA